MSKLEDTVMAGFAIYELVSSCLAPNQTLENLYDQFGDIQQQDHERQMQQRERDATVASRSSNSITLIEKPR